MEKKKTRTKKIYSRYSKKLADEIAKDYASGKYTIDQICESRGLAKSTYYQWKEKYPYFSNELQKALDHRRFSLKEMAESNLVKLMNGFEYEERTLEGKEGAGGKLTNKQVKIVKKFIPPNPTVNIFMAKKMDPVNYPEKSEIEHSGHMIQKVEIEHVYPEKIDMDE